LAVPEDAAQRAGQTPPAESGVSALDAREPERLARGWAWSPVTVIVVFVALFCAGMLAQAIYLMV
jgi:hypothetical protein